LTTWRSPFIMICRKPLPGTNGCLAFKTQLTNRLAGSRRRPVANRIRCL
jgi:hypothetical protein